MLKQGQLIPFRLDQLADVQGKMEKLNHEHTRLAIRLYTSDWIASGR